MSQTKAQLLDGSVVSVSFGAGSAAAPSINYSAETTTGIYFPTSAQLAFSTAGVQRLLINGTGNVNIPGTFSVTGQITAASGSVSTPSILLNGGGNPGIYSPAANQLAIVGGGSTFLTASSSALTATVPHVVPAGTATANGIQVGTGTTYNPGIYSPGTDQIGIATGGTSRIVVDASGNVNIDSNTLYVDAVNNRVGIGTTSPAAPLQVLGETLSTTFVANGTYIVGPPQALQVMQQGKLRLSAGSQAQFGADIYTVKNSAFEDNISLVFAVPSIGSSSPTERLRIDFAGTTTLTSAASTAPFIAKISTTEVARIDSSGRLLVGTSTGLYSLTSPVMALKGSFVSETFGTPSTGPTTLTAAIETGTGGQIHVTSQQGGVGSSYRVVPFVKDISGNLTLGAAITTTVRTADPIGTITAVSNNIDIVVTFANTRVAYWIQYVAIPF